MSLSVRQIRRFCWPQRLLCLAFFAVSFPSWAVLFEPIPIEVLAQKADLVVHGTILSKACQRDSEGRIYTQVELRADELWKGSISGSPIRVVHGGGTLGDRHSIVSGQVNYDIGEEVVAFLVRNDRGDAVTLGLMQGKFRVWQDDQTGTKHVFNPFYGTPKSATAAIQTQNNPKALDVHTLLPIADLRRRVQEAIR